MDHPEEEVILDYDEDKNDDVIYEKEVNCAGVWWSRRDSRPVERLEPHCDNEKSYFQWRK